MKMTYTPTVEGGYTVEGDHRTPFDSQLERAWQEYLNKNPSEAAKSICEGLSGESLAEHGLEAKVQAVVTAVVELLQYIGKGK